MTDHTILLVDDEPAILNSLRRVFRQEAYEILTAESGEAGLALLAERDVSLIISDQRMPGMIGAEFLTRARVTHPGAMRVILTGHADMDAVVQAINEGGVHRYLLKPWDDNELRQMARELLELRQLRLENQRLQDELHQRNQELEQLNQGLEDKVQARTAQLREAHGELTLRVAELEGRDRVVQHLLGVHTLDDTLTLIAQVIEEILPVHVRIWVEGNDAAVGSLDEDQIPATGVAAARSGASAIVNAEGIAIVALRREEETVGFIGARHAQAGTISPQHERVLSSFASQAAVAVLDALLQSDFPAWQRELDDVMGDLGDGRAQ